MKDRPKLGRGLRDVSRYFLSGSPQGGLHSDEDPSPDHLRRTACIVSPASPLMQSFLTSNLALELVRYRFGVKVLDFVEPGEARVRTLVHSVLDGQAEGQDGAVSVSLYGLPRIEIQDGTPTGVFTGPEDSGTSQAAKERGPGRFVLVNACPKLDFILMSAPVDDAVIITRADENSLLQCYAFIKVMCERSKAGDIKVAFELGESDDPQLLFGRLSEFVGHRLGRSLEFLGAMVHDECLERSISEKRPLVLQTGTSAAREALVGICSRIIEGILRQGRGGGS